MGIVPKRGLDHPPPPPPQVASPQSYRSQLITQGYYNNQCVAAFGVTPDTAGFNQRFGSYRNNTRVIALQGSDDPWQGAGVQASLSADYVEYLATCDGCGHCGDLHAPGAGTAPAVLVQQAAISTYLGAWLAAL